MNLLRQRCLCVIDLAEICPQIKRLWGCGGGRRNDVLLQVHTVCTREPASLQAGWCIYQQVPSRLFLTLAVSTQRVLTACLLGRPWGWNLPFMQLLQELLS